MLGASRLSAFQRSIVNEKSKIDNDEDIYKDIYKYFERSYIC